MWTSLVAHFANHFMKIDSKSSSGGFTTATKVATDSKSRDLHCQIPIERSINICYINFDTKLTTLVSDKCIDIKHTGL